MITVKIDNETALDMLMDRLDNWTSDPDAIELFSIMYERYIDEGLFDGGEFDPMSIVDNDYVNWCSVIEESEPDFERLLELYESGDWDVSCEHLDCGAQYIEAVNEDKTAILIRH